MMRFTKVSISIPLFASLSMKTFLLLFAFAFGLAGCATHQFAQPDARWKTRTGQLLYREGDRSIVGDLALSSSGENLRLEFNKAGLSLLRLERDASHARFDGPLARLSHTISLPAKKGSRDAGWLEVAQRATRERQFQVTAEGAKFSVQIAPGR